MSYRAPVTDMLFTLKRAAGLARELELGGYGELTEDVIDAVVEEAGRFATDVIAPLNRIGDLHGARLNDGNVTTPPGFKEAYRAWIAAGWNALAGPTQFAGQGLPHALNAACIELWNQGSMAFGVGPVLTMGAVEALAAHGTAELKRIYLPKLVSGEWMGTMQLTEAHAGSDLSALRTKAEPAGDGSYRLTGQKIFITYGEHDLTANIVHFVLARLVEAPAGSRGLSLFLVPKFLVEADGRLGARNDVRCHSIEHKLGIHGSPTCTMVYGDAGGATGFLVGEANRGLACMFTMMNNARLAIGLQGVAIAERATQQALAYAHTRRQGRAPQAGDPGMSPIIAHPDVKRMLLTMRALTRAARAICYKTAVAIDRSHRLPTAAERQVADARASLLTPVAKAFATDVGIQVASLGVQVHGGMGYIEETGAAQHFRDARIGAIYEGTNGIQAIDLVTRKLPLADGAAIGTFARELRASVADLSASNHPELGGSGTTLAATVDSLERATDWVRDRVNTQPETALAAATPYLRLVALAAGGCALGEEAIAAQRLETEHGEAADAAEKIALASYFAQNLAVDSAGLERAVIDGSGTVTAAAAALRM
jgi:acyl-CoA dehydrogenase